MWSTVVQGLFFFGIGLLGLGAKFSLGWALLTGSLLLFCIPLWWFLGLFRK